MKEIYEFWLTDFLDHLSVNKCATNHPYSVVCIHMLTYVIKFKHQAYTYVLRYVQCILAYYHIKAPTTHWHNTNMYNTYICTYCTYMHTYVRTVCTCIRMYVRTVRTYVCCTVKGSTTVEPA